MPRYAVPASNTSFSTHLFPAFNTYSLGTMGSRIYPRETVGGTAVSELRPTSFLYRIPSVAIYDRSNSQLNSSTAGDVEVTSPFSLGPTSTINMGYSYVINDDTYTTITISYTGAYGYQLCASAWLQEDLTTFISANNPATLTLSNSAVYGALTIYANAVTDLADC